ncbi:hypothetical protein [Aquibaculum arenosum]|uniref:Uncharacterized protein n=1 Tax=Aquibaculum arenosum TaxID=3032591 RepID=A0ABT5YIM0_9PROT|nr:hypothetical protein [Fodinicurvata sp. CAU 1616]MDF2094785.1 hypothetical protein [Fodinicurvata sp. CAU 1616]
MRVVSEILGYVFLAVTVLLLALELWTWHSTQADFRFRPIGLFWYSIDPASLSLTQAGIERHLLPWLWDPLLLTVLNWGAVPVFAILAVFFFAMGRRR